MRIADFPHIACLSLTSSSTSLESYSLVTSLDLLLCQSPTLFFFFPQKTIPEETPPEYLTTNIAQDQMLPELAVPASSFINSHNNPYCQKHTKLSMQQYEVLTQQE